jgi:hypothetical protein
MFNMDGKRLSMAMTIRLGFCGRLGGGDCDGGGGGGEGVVGGVGGVGGEVEGEASFVEVDDSLVTAADCETFFFFFFLPFFFADTPKSSARRRNKRRTMHAVDSNRMLCKRYVVYRSSNERAQSYLILLSPHPHTSSPPHLLTIISISIIPGTLIP